MSSYNLPTFGLAIDWETSGFSLPNYTAKHQGISFGAIIFDLKSLKSVEGFYREIKFNEKYTWDMGAERVHGLTKAYLSKNGVDQEKAAVDLGNLVAKYMGTDEIILLGHRVYFDKAFTVQLMQSIGVDFSFHPTVIDSSSMGTILMENARSDDIFQTLGLPARGKHNAFEDITYTLNSVARMKDLFIKGVISELNE